MARIARIVVAGIPHHVTQRGNRRQQVFFEDADYRAYLDSLAEHCRDCGVSVWAWCLMPNHVHLMLVPSTPGSLSSALIETHRRYSRRINFREGWRGYLWQGRFASAPMDDTHTLACARYIELNPVRARLVVRPDDWTWSSARAHLEGRVDGVTDIAALGTRIDNWRDFLSTEPTDQQMSALRGGERTGRPLGDQSFIAQLEIATGRQLAKQKPGPKPKGISGQR